MKKILILVIVIIFVCCSSCNKSKENSMVKYEIGIYYDKNWENPVGTYQEDVIPDKNTAIAIATQIFNQLSKNSYMQNWIPQVVFFDQEDEIWIVSFWEETDEIIYGDDCSIALQKKDGKVLRIWFGE